MANEKRLIDANAVIEKLTNFTPNGWGKDVPYIRSQWAMAVKIKDNFLKAITDAPTVEAVEVVHGRWLYDSGSGKHFCSACDEYALSFKKDTLYGGELYEVCLTDYCPNCGAKMDGDGNV